MQKLLYLGVILAGIVIVLSGLAIWKPVQLQELTALFGGYDAARYVHFFAMAAIVGFLVVHVVHGAAGAEEPARHDHRPLRRTAMSRIRKIRSRRRSEAPDQGRGEAACPIRRGGCSCAAARASAR